MKVLFTVSLLVLTTICYSQKVKNFYRWVPTKETICRINELGFGGNNSSKKIRVLASYSWSKQKCTEQEFKDQKKVKKPKKGLQSVAGKEYYYDGKLFYEVFDTYCSSRGITLSNFFRILDSL